MVGLVGLRADTVAICSHPAYVLLGGVGVEIGPA